jgi:hypothetical protein
MERLEVQDPKLSEQPDSLASLLYTLQFTIFRITLHSLAAFCLILRLHALLFVFAYKSCTKQANPLFHMLRSTLNSPTRTIRNLYRLYRIVSSQPQVVEVAETPVPSIDDAVSVESVLQKRLGVQEYHDTLHKVRRGGSLELPILLRHTASELAPEVREEPPDPSKLDLQPVLSATIDNPEDGNACLQCAHERLGCVTCTQATRNSSVDTSIPRKAKSDGEFRPPPPAANDEYLKLPWRQVQAKKSGKLQKRAARY